MKTQSLIIGLVLLAITVFVGYKIFRKVKEKGLKRVIEDEKSDPKNDNNVTPFDGTKETFARNIIPYAKAIEKETGIPWKWIVAHQGMETGFGKSSLVKEAFNFGGIKAREGQDFVLKPTFEHVTDFNKYPDRIPFKSKETGEMVKQERVNSTKWRIRIKAKFAKYSSIADGLQGYKKILLLKRYESCLGIKNPYDYGACIMSKGYGTDVNYMKKMEKILATMEDVYKNL